MIKFRISKNFAIFLAILVLGVFLRFYRLPQNLVFHGELGDNYLAIKNFIFNHQIPVLGPPTSHPWLSFGPLFYWIFIPIMYLGNFNPIAGAYFMAFLGSLLIVVNYFFVKKLFGQRQSLISSFLIAISPLWIGITRESRFFSLSVFFFYPFYYFLLNQKFFLAFFFLGLGLNFHWSLLIFLPGGLLYLFQRNKFKKFKSAFLGFILAQTPFLFGSILTDYKMLGKFALWLPYRVVSNPVQKFQFQAIFEFLRKMFLPPQITLGWFFGACVVVLFFWKAYKQYRLLGNLFLFGIMALIIHGLPPSHYFLPLYPILPIFLAILLTKSKVPATQAVFLLSVIFLVNMMYFFSNKWFFIDQTILNSDQTVPYKLQLTATKSILNDAKGADFSLKRMGSYDYFDQNYSQNFKYLLWLGGNEPKEKSNLVYTICETDCLKKINFDKYWQFSNLYVVRSKK